MNEVYCIDMATGKSFTKYFDDVRRQKAFITRCRHGRKIWIEGYTWQDEDEHEYLAGR